MVQVKRVAGYQQEQETPLGVSEHNLGKQVFTEGVIEKAEKADQEVLHPTTTTTSTVGV